MRTKSKKPAPSEIMNKMVATANDYPHKELYDIKGVDYMMPRYRAMDERFLARNDYTYPNSLVSFMDYPFPFRNNLVNYLNGMISFKMFARMTMYPNPTNLVWFKHFLNNLGIKIWYSYELIVHNGVDDCFDNFIELASALGVEYNPISADANKAFFDLKRQVNQYCYLDENGVSVWSGGQRDYHAVINGKESSYSSFETLVKETHIAKTLLQNYLSFDKQGLAFTREINMYVNCTNYRISKIAKNLDKKKVLEDLKASVDVESEIIG